MPRRGQSVLPPSMVSVNAAVAMVAGLCPLPEGPVTSSGTAIPPANVNVIMSFIVSTAAASRIRLVAFARYSSALVAPPRENCVQTPVYAPRATRNTRHAKRIVEWPRRRAHDSRVGDVGETSDTDQRTARGTYEPTRTGERTDHECAREVDGTVDAHEQRAWVARILPDEQRAWVARILPECAVGSRGCHLAANWSI